MAWNQFEYFVFRYNRAAAKVSRFASFWASLAAFALLIYRYGFLLTPGQLRWTMLGMNLIFGVYVALFLLRLVFTADRLLFLKEERVEAALAVGILLHWVFNLLGGVKLVLYYMQLLSFANPALSYEHFVTLYLLFWVILELARGSTRLPDLRVKPALTFLASFVILIGGGAWLLTLPAMTVNGLGMPWLNALFTSASASCVTGLVVEDTGLYFTTKGHIVLMILIQLGGLGIVLFATFFASFLSTGVGLKHQLLMQDHLSSESLASAKELLRKVVFITFIIEALGAVCIFFTVDNAVLPPEHQFRTLSEAIFSAIFHSISAFCNAGFSLFPGGYYHEAVRIMYPMHFFSALLIMFGGIGFGVIEDIFSPASIRERLRKPWKHWALGTKIPLYTSLILVALGTVGFMGLEFAQLTDRTIVEALVTAFFQSVVTRTAGFNTMDFETLRTPTVIMSIFLMFIGAAPGSTGGGIKVNTFTLILLASLRNIRGEKKINISHRYIPDDLVNKAFTLLLFAVTFNSLAIFALTITEAEPGRNILRIVFEQISAFATVGLSMNYTDELSAVGKVIIIVTMFIGRVGPLTLAVSLSGAPRTNLLKYPRTYLMIG
jgi:trk system potassium uptake protein